MNQMIPYGARPVNHAIDWCRFYGCLWVVLPSGDISRCLRCGVDYPYDHDDDDEEDANDGVPI